MVNSKNIYSVFGINILSENLKLPELNKSKGTKYDVEIIKLNTPIDNNIKKFPYKYKNLFIRNNQLNLHIKGIADFQVCDGEKIYWHDLQKEFIPSQVRAYILGSAIGAILIQRGNTVIHANALTKDSKTIICAGNGGDGKSTLAYSLMRQGWKLLSDDLVALSDDFCVLPGIPRIKLWDDAISYYGIEKNTLKRVREDMNKYQLTGDCVNSVYTKCKINAIYVLDKNKDTNVKSEISSQKEKFLRVHNHIYRPLYVNGLHKGANYFKKLTKLIKQIPVYKLSLPRTLSKMDKWLSINTL